MAYQLKPHKHRYGFGEGGSLRQCMSSHFLLLSSVRSSLFCLLWLMECFMGLINLLEHFYICSNTHYTQQHTRKCAKCPILEGSGTVFTGLTRRYRCRFLIWASLLQQENNPAETGNANYVVDYNYKISKWKWQTSESFLNLKYITSFTFPAL
jgi:hypothetical protein